MAVLEPKDFYGVTGYFLTQSARDSVTQAARFEKRDAAIRSVAATLQAAWAVSAAIGKEAKEAPVAVQQGLYSDLVKHLRSVLGDVLAKWSAENDAPDKAEQYALLESAASWALVGAQDPTGKIALEDFGGATIVVQPPADLADFPIDSANWSIVVM